MKYVYYSSLDSFICSLLDCSTVLHILCIRFLSAVSSLPIHFRWYTLNICHREINVCWFILLTNVKTRLNYGNKNINNLSSAAFDWLYFEFIVIKCIHENEATTKCAVSIWLIANKRSNFANITIVVCFNEIYKDLDFFHNHCCWHLRYILIWSLNKIVTHEADGDIFLVFYKKIQINEILEKRSEIKCLQKWYTNQTCLNYALMCGSLFLQFRKLLIKEVIKLKSRNCQIKIVSITLFSLCLNLILSRRRRWLWNWTPCCDDFKLFSVLPRFLGFFWVFFVVVFFCVGSLFPWFCFV